MRAFKGFIGERVLCDGVVYRIHGCGLRGSQLVFYAYSSTRECEVRMTMRDVMDGLVAPSKSAATAE